MNREVEPGGSKNQSPIRFTDIYDEMFSQYLLATCLTMTATMVLWRTRGYFIEYVRTVTSINDYDQHYHTVPDYTLSFLKRNIFYSPLRRERPKLCGGGLTTQSHVAVTPSASRLTVSILAVYLVINLAFGVVNITFDGDYTDVAFQLHCWK
jgi:hypothetical protein